MAPLTRSRARTGAADALTALYYTQRASAGLIISEGTPISREGQGYLFNPGIFRGDQIAGWRRVAGSVRGAGERMFAQPWPVGTVSHVSLREDDRDPVSASGTIARQAPAFAFDGDARGYTDYQAYQRP